MLGTIACVGLYVESSIEPTNWTEGMFGPEMKALDGKAPISDGPDWGVTIIEDWLVRADRQARENV